MRIRCRAKDLWSVAATILFITTNFTIALPSNQAPGTKPPAPSSQTSKTLAQRLCSNYSQIKTISCEIRKTTKGKGQTLRILSRVHYKFPNHIHVENVSPVKRRIIADGKDLYYYQERNSRGFSKPIDELSETWLTPLRNIPGTALEHLIPLCGIEEVISLKQKTA